MNLRYLIIALRDCCESLIVKFSPLQVTGNDQHAIRFKVGIISFVVLSCLFCSGSSRMAMALNGADVALYNDAIAPSGTSGVWQDGIIAITNMLTWMDITYEEITYDDLNNSSQDFSSLYKVLLFPGGYAYWYNYWITPSGKERIRNFISSGGGYFGICAGSFFAADVTVWEGIPYDDDAGYDLDLFPGIATGPITAIADWNAEGYNMATFNFQNENAALSSYRPTPYSENILYFGGPYFSVYEGAEVEVLGTFAYNGEPAIVAFQYGSGRVLLSAPHPEIEEDSIRDGVTIDREDEMDDDGSDWGLVLHIFNWLMNVEGTIIHTLTPPSDTTTPRGGVLGPFSASAVNNTDSEVTFQLQPYLVTLDKTRRLMFTNEVTLSPGETSFANNSNDIYIGVSPFASIGKHWHCVNVYDMSSHLIDQDCYSFDVTGDQSKYQRLKSKETLRRLIRTPGARVSEMDGWKMIIIPKKHNKERRN